MTIKDEIKLLETSLRYAQGEPHKRALIKTISELKEKLKGKNNG